MSVENYVLDFGGYWIETESIPTKSGIYGVYSCVHDNQSNKVNRLKLLYIGEAEDVESRIASHELRLRWEGYLRWDETLCFNMAPIFPEGARKRAEAAVIYHHKPPCNTQYATSFPFDKTTVTITGKAMSLDHRFVVTRT